MPNCANAGIFISLYEIQHDKLNIESLCFNPKYPTKWTSIFTIGTTYTIYNIYRIVPMHVYSSSCMRYNMIHIESLCFNSEYLTKWLQYIHNRDNQVCSDI